MSTREEPSMTNQSLDQKYGLVPGPTSYREAVIVPIARIPQDDAEHENIRALSEKDRNFCRLLQEDQVCVTSFGTR